MGENKMCSSCGNSIPAEAVFCPNCGSNQASVPVEPAQPSQVEAGQKAVEETVQPSQKTEVPEYKPEPVQSASPQQPQRPVQQNVSVQAASPQMQRPQQAYPQGYPQAFQGNQQPYYGQPQQAPAPEKPKRKFPWVFTIVWVVMLAFVGIWGYCLLLLPGYQVPEITTDTVRILSFAVSVILLIYTLNVRLMTKKFKVIPTVLLVVFLLVSLFMYASFEMVGGDWLHDAISPITDAIFQVQ